MRTSEEQPAIRSLFVSDVHLGFRFAQTEAFLNYLSRFRPQYVYLVGDFIDGWKLKSEWFWDDACDRIIDHLLDLGRRGTIIRYTPGNHDDFLRAQTGLGEAVSQLDFLEIREEFIHVTADRRRFLVIHGDQFDYVERRASWLSKLSSLVYDPLLALSRAWFWRVLKRRHESPYGLCNFVKRQVKRIVKCFSVYESILVAHARQRQCDGVICGHVHAPMIALDGAVSYCNTGDWVETCTAIVEHHDGRLELQRYYPTAQARTTRKQPRPTPQPQVAPWRRWPAPAVLTRENATC